MHTCRPIATSVIWVIQHNLCAVKIRKQHFSLFPHPLLRENEAKSSKEQNHSVTVTKSLLPVFLGRPGHNLYSVNMSLLLSCDSCLC